MWDVGSKLPMGPIRLPGVFSVVSWIFCSRAPHTQPHWKAYLTFDCITSKGVPLLMRRKGKWEGGGGLGKRAKGKKEKKFGQRVTCFFSSSLRNAPILNNKMRHLSPSCYFIFLILIFFNVSFSFLSILVLSSALSACFRFQTPHLISLFINLIMESSSHVCVWWVRIQASVSSFILSPHGPMKENRACSLSLSLSALGGSNLLALFIFPFPLCFPDVLSSQGWLHILL